MAKTTRQIIEALAERFEPEVRAAFLAAVNDIRDNAQIARLSERIEAGDLDGVYRALGFNPAAFMPLDQAIRASFETGGVAVTSTLPRLAGPDGIVTVFRFDARNPRAEAWLRDHSSTMVREILDDQRQMVRQALTAGVEAGRNPRSIALDLTGRVSRATGRREGGLIGLTSTQEQYSRNAMAELRSGDPAAMRNYLTRGRRDERFDRTVLRAIQEGRPVDAAQAQKMVMRYRDGLLNLRGEVIGRLEAKASLNQATQEAFTQAVETGAVQQQDVRRTWRHSGNRNPREQHIAMTGQTVGLNEPFVAPDGTRLMYPNDPRAPISHTANCRCQQDVRIDFLSNLE